MLDASPAVFVAERSDMQQFFGLDEAALSRLRAVGQKMAPRLPEFLGAFYDHVGDIPTLASLIASAGGVDRLKKAQAAHWLAMFESVTSPEFKARTERIGAAHERIGLSPEWYLGGYLRMAESMIGAILESHRKPADAHADIAALLRGLLFDMSMSLDAYVRLGAVNAVKNEILTISDMLEREATNTVGEIAHKAARFNQIARQVAQRSQDLETIVSELAETAEKVSGEVQTIASSATEMETSATTIGTHMSHAAKISESVGARAKDAQASVERLEEAASQIANVVKLIRTIASQTKLLSLNATIEAARAGEAGKGFAVVAGEVKTLAAQTEASIADVSAQVEAIRNGTASTVDTIGQVGTAIGSMDEAADEIRHATSEQQAASSEIARCMAGAADGATSLAGRMGEIARQAVENNTAALTLADMSGALNSDMVMLRDRIMGIVGTSTVKSDHIRVPVAMDAELVLSGGRRTPQKIVDLSLAGALIRPRSGHQPEKLPMGTPITLDFPKVGQIAAQALMPSSGALHIQFLPLPATQESLLRALLVDHKDRDDQMAGLCQAAARDIEGAFKTALKSGRITEAALFDESYRPIPDTNPPQVLTAFTDFTDSVLPAIQERTMQQDPSIVFCAALDRNAYLPTHNTPYSKPQKPGDVAWNMANSRNRRIFDDRAGLLAAHNRSPAFFQTYDRDMGGGRIVFLKEVDVPITVNNRHWGNLRLAYKG